MPPVRLFRWSAVCGFALAVLAGASLPMPRAPAQEVSAEQVRRAIDQGKRFLLEQLGRGRLVTLGPERYPGGVTALGLLALLNCGESPQQPVVRQALQAIVDVPEEHLMTYVTSLRIMALAAADPRQYRAQIARDVQWLERAQVTADPYVGGWGYSLGSNVADASNSQFAILALHEARQIGVTVNEIVFSAARQYWEGRFEPQSGGFTYSPAHRDYPYGSMTCAGIAALIIVDENLRRASDSLDPQGHVACCRGTRGDDLLQRAIDWMGANLQIHTNPGFDPMTKYYYLYGLERAGRLTGRRFFGAYDWYRLGAVHLLKLQKGTGAWQGTGMLGEDNELVATSFALLFLSKGKRPVVLGKYQHADAEPAWDPHPKGVHYLTRQLEAAWKIPLNWQTIDGRRATAEDLNECDVLFISGTDQLRLDDRQRQALRLFVDSGKFIFAEAAHGDGCDGAEFDRQFRQLMADLFPETPLRELSPGHPIWTSQFKLLPSPERPLLGIEASCRTSVVYCPKNLACLWALNQPAWLEGFPPQARQQIEYATQLGINVVTYATGRELRDKGDQPSLAADVQSELASRLLEIPKLAHAGGADDAPNAWRNVLQRFQYDLQMPISLKTVLVEPKLEVVQKYPILFMHGRIAFEFSDRQRDDLRKYFQQGGFLFIDTICASKPFADSVRRELQAILPDRELENIPADHEIWSDRFHGYSLKQVTLRTPDRRPDGTSTPLERTTHPLLEMLRLENGRIAVVFSPYDLSCAMENAAASQCSGYKRDDAARIGVNVILYALQQPESAEQLDTSR